MADFVEGFLSNYPDQVQAISRSLRDLARHEMKAKEFLYYDAINYSLTSSPLDRFCYIKPLPREVTLGFLYGKGLEDPGRLLHGIGQRARYVRLRTLEETKNPSLKELVKNAWKHASDSIAKMKQLRKHRPPRAHRPRRRQTKPRRS